MLTVNAQMFYCVVMVVNAIQKGREKTGTQNSLI